MSSNHYKSSGDTETDAVAERTPYSRDYSYGDGSGYYYNGYDTQTNRESSWSVVNYWRVLLFRKWVVLGVFAAVLALGYSQTRQAKPVWTSQATIEVQKMHPTSTNLNDVFASFGQFDVYFQTQMLALRDRRLAEAYLVSTKQLPPLPDAGAEAKESVSENGQPGPETSLNDERARSSLINAMLSRIKVETVQGTQLINVELTADDPLTAQKMLKGYLDTFIQYDTTKRSRFADGLRGLLKSELEEAEKQLRKSEQDLQDFTSEHGLVITEKYPDETTAFLNRASQNYIQTRDKRLHLEAMDKAKETFLPGQTQEQYLHNLKSQLAQLKSEYASMATIYSPDYFKLVLLKSRIEGMEEAIADLEKSTLSSMLDAAKKSENIASEAYEQTKQEAMKRSPVAAQFEILKRIMDANGQLYVNILQKYKNASVEQGLMGHNVAIFSPPSLPLAPIQASKTKTLIIAAIFGLLGGIAVAFTMEKLDNKVRTTEELERALRVPILGVVPKTELVRRRQKKERSRDAMVEFMPFLVPLSQLADALRVIENATESLLMADSPVVICLSSALPLEGKTFMNVAMGTVMACENKRVLVIDGDLRRPRVQKLFESESKGPGLSDLLDGSCTDVLGTVRESHVPGLYYMPAGTAPQNPVGLLKNGKLSAILEQCKEHFDVIFLDAPPFMGMADASILARHADGLILVARQGYAPVDVLRKTHEFIQVGKIRLLGIILNMVYRDSGEYDYYTSKYSYRYNNKKIA